MKFSKILLAGMITTGSLFAHGTWINTFDGLSKKGGYITIGLGTGHNLSIDDAVSASTKLKSFDLITPSNQKIELEKPMKKITDIYEDKSFRITPSNLAMQKVTFDKATPKGTYSVALVGEPRYFTKYIDNKGKERFKRASRDSIKNAKKILVSEKFMGSAKSYFVFKEWSEVKPLGHTLEIIPTTDISKLYIGDTLTLDVLYEGKPIKFGYITARNSLGKGDNPLFSVIRDGKAKFVLTNAGQWEFDTAQEKMIEGIKVVNRASATINIK